MEEKRSSKSNNNYRQLTSSFLNTPRLFTGFVSKGSAAEAESVMGSPTSILDAKPFSAALKNPFFSDKTAHKANIWDSRGLVDALTDEKSDPDSSKPDRRMVLFGSQLKIILQVPSHESPPPPKSPRDFGIKTRNNNVASPRFLSPSSLRKSMFGVVSPSNSCCFTSEMELSEDYTCVISHGPNPTTKHIFDDCVVESCFGDDGRRRFPLIDRAATSYPSDGFLSFCYGCKKQLERGKDIYIYRGEKAFCSSDCREKEIMLEDEEEEELSGASSSS